MKRCEPEVAMLEISKSFQPSGFGMPAGNFGSLKSQVGSCPLVYMKIRFEATKVRARKR